MRAENVAPQSATTDILDLHSPIAGNLTHRYRRLVCEITTRRSSYLSPFVARRNDTWCAKWDPLRMRALGAKAVEFHQEITNAEPSERHHWSIGDLLVIDNWRCLHRRSEASLDSPRVIQRVVVKDRPE
ncbi:TauD/TfdA family dioxygenase [Streptomyces sp. NPDC048350]|uniref:TauD/TfdA family dioxygenase n=1 Tax=Streptomyces sp. NPDC048350 TaxID=3365538 RepID=UPI00371645C1